MSIRIAAVGDVHVAPDTSGQLSPTLASVNERADLLLLAGDLTRNGYAGEAAVLATELADVHIPIYAVLGNHDHHQGEQDEIIAILRGAGVTVLEGSSTAACVAGETVGIVGVKGFGGGFVGECASDYGEPEMKAYVRHTKHIAATLRNALGALDTDYRVVLMHYSPVPDTLRGEPLAIYPFLGSYLLAEAIDHHGADLVLHGHAHAGSERGTTPAGHPVRNVAQPVIKHTYRLYCLGHSDGDGCDEVHAHALGTRAAALA